VKPLLYVASPYSHPDPEVRLARYWAAVKKAAELMKAGNNVFSPISHTHEIGLILGDAVDHDFWLSQDRAILRHCDKLVVLLLPGWSESKGVAEEIAFARVIGIPVGYETP